MKSVFNAIWGQNVASDTIQEAVVNRSQYEISAPEALETLQLIDSISPNFIEKLKIHFNQRQEVIVAGVDPKKNCEDLASLVGDWEAIAHAVKISPQEFVAALDAYSNKLLTQLAQIHREVTDPKTTAERCMQLKKERNPMLSFVGNNVIFHNMIEKNEASTYMCNKPY